MLSGFWSRVTQTVFVLDFEPLLWFWTDTILAQTTQSRLFSSTDTGWYCLLSVFASKPARRWLGRQPGLARPCLQQLPNNWNLIQKDILRWLLHFLVHSKWMQQAKLNSILQKFFQAFFDLQMTEKLWRIWSLRPTPPMYFWLAHCAGGQGIASCGPAWERHWTVVGAPMFSGGWIVEIKYTGRLSHHAMSARLPWLLHKKSPRFILFPW